MARAMRMMRAGAMYHTASRFSDCALVISFFTVTPPFNERAWAMQTGFIDAGSKKSVKRGDFTIPGG